MILAPIYVGIAILTLAGALFLWASRGQSAEPGLSRVGSVVCGTGTSTASPSAGRRARRRMAVRVTAAILVVASGVAVVLAVQAAGLPPMTEMPVVGVAAACAAFVGHAALERLEPNDAVARAKRWESTLSERFGSALAGDAAEALAATETARNGEETDPVALSLVIAAKHGASFDAVVEWGVENGVAGRERFEAARRRLADRGVIADVDRSADRLVLTDDRLADASGSQLASMTSTMAT